MMSPSKENVALHTTRGTIDFSQNATRQVTIVAMGALDVFPIPLSSFIYVAASLNRNQA